MTRSAMKPLPPGIRPVAVLRLAFGLTLSFEHEDESKRAARTAQGTCPEPTVQFLHPMLDRFWPAKQEPAVDLGPFRSAVATFLL